MALVARPQPEPEPDVPVGHITRPHWIAWVFVVAGVAMQLLILTLVWDYRHKPVDCGESCAYAGMGLMVILLGGAIIWLPGIAAAVWLFVVHWRRQQVRGGQKEPLALLGGALVVPMVMFVQIALSDHKIVRQKPTVVEPVLSAGQVRTNDEVAGYAWASDTGLRDESACAKGTPGFQAGCRKFVRAFTDTTADGRSRGAVLRLDP